MQERKIRDFWYAEDGFPRIVTGYGTDGTDCWWVPSLRYSLWAGRNLFETRQEALLNALEKADAKVKEAASLRALIVSAIAGG